MKNEMKRWLIGVVGIIVGVVGIPGHETRNDWGTRKGNQMKGRPMTAVLLTMLTATLAAAPFGISGQQVTLKWKYEAGAELNYRQTVSTETEMPGQGTATTEMIYTLRWNVLDVADNGDATVRLTTDRIQMSMDGPMGTMSIDSASAEEAAAPQMKIFTALAGMSYTLVVGPNGELRSLEGMEELRQRIRESLADEQIAMLDQMLDQSFSDDAMKNMFQQGVQSFPEGEVGAGDTWDASLDTAVPMIGSMTTHMTYTLERFDERGGATIAIISNLGTTEMTAEEDSPMAGMMQFGNAASTSIGTIEFDVDRGLLVKSTGSMTMEMTLSMGGQEQVMGAITNVMMELVEGRP